MSKNSKHNIKEFPSHSPRPPLEPKNESQKYYKIAIESGELVIAHGSAGAGKTYIPSVIFSDLFCDKRLSRIIITRPTVECGESLGALPGELEEKTDPWWRHIERVMKERMGQGLFDLHKKRGNISFLPLQYMRGETFDNAAILVDEAQNLTVDQVKMVITRIGNYSKMIICGDTTQSDLNDNKNGLSWLINEINRQNIDGIDIIKFTLNDCQRSDMCKKMIQLIERAE